MCDICPTFARLPASVACCWHNSNINGSSNIRCVYRQKQKPKSKNNEKGNLDKKVKRQIKKKTKTKSAQHGYKIFHAFVIYVLKCYRCYRRLCVSVPVVGAVVQSCWPANCCALTVGINGMAGGGRLPWAGGVACGATWLCHISSECKAVKSARKGQ